MMIEFFCLVKTQQNMPLRKNCVVYTSVVRKVSKPSGIFIVRILI